MPLARQLEHHWFVHPNPLVLGTDPLKYPTPTKDKDQTVSRRQNIKSGNPAPAPGLGLRLQQKRLRKSAIGHQSIHGGRRGGAQLGQTERQQAIKMIAPLKGISAPAEVIKPGAARYQHRNLMTSLVASGNTYEFHSESAVPEPLETVPG